MPASQTRAAEPIKPPSTLLTLAELHRAMFELSTLPLAAPILAKSPRGDGHPVLVMPGFIAGDSSTDPLRRFLKMLGYDAHAWELGRNLGPHAIGRQGEKLMARFEEIHRETGRKVSLVGWSLGGVMARELSRRAPDAVRQVITLGSPFTGDPMASKPTKLYQAITGEGGDNFEARLKASSEPPPVPSTAIYSKTDGVVAWRNCVEEACPTTDNVEVHGSHCGLGVNPTVLYVIADRLAQPEGQWTPFDRSGWRTAFYPSSGHLH
jgi:pimeloyl-ACP methyl ester carboxylesterase